GRGGEGAGARGLEPGGACQAHEDDAERGGAAGKRARPALDPHARAVRQGDRAQAEDQLRCESGGSRSPDGARRHPGCVRCSVRATLAPVRAGGSARRLTEKLRRPALRALMFRGEGKTKYGPPPGPEKQATGAMTFVCCLMEFPLQLIFTATRDSEQ